MDPLIVENLVRLLLILGITWLVAKISGWLVLRLLKSRSLNGRRLDERRLLTLQSLVGSAIKVAIWIVSIVIVLFSLGVSGGAILTTLGCFRLPLAWARVPSSAII